jgi:hypothetical protein
MRTALRCLPSVVIGLLLLFPLGAVYGAASLPVYHSWGLAHGSFATAIPALVAAAFVALGLISWFGKVNDVLPRLIACASVLVLVTTLFLVEQSSQYALSVWHVVVYVALFGIFLLICMRAQRPLLIPLFLVVPLLIDPVFGLVLTAGYDSPVALQIFGSDLLRRSCPWSLLPASPLSSLGCAVVRPNPSLHPKCNSWLRQLPPSGELKR